MHILIIGDTHLPYHSEEAFSGFYKSIAKMKPFTHIVQVGDLYDFYNLSRYPRSLDLDKPREEIEKARKCAVKMWRKLRRLYPQAKCYQLIGNHDERLRKRIISAVPELYEVIDLKHLWDFDGVTSKHCQRDELIIGDVVFLHGHYSRVGAHMNHNMTNTAYGHTHKGSCVFRRTKDTVIWEINAATMADLSSPPMSYTAQRQYSTFMNGFAIIDEFGPRFIPLVGGKTWRKT